MAQETNAASSTSKKQPTVAEIKAWYAENKDNIVYAKKGTPSNQLRDVTQPSKKPIRSIDREALKGYIENITGSEQRLRNISRYLYYRSNIYYRLINFYADMWDLRCRKVIPSYNLTRENDKKKFLKSYNDTLTILDRMNLQGNMTEVLINTYMQDVCYTFAYYDDTGMFFYILDPDECVIDSRYSTSDFGFAVDMSKWRSVQRQKVIEFLGSPLKEMYEEYQNNPSNRWVHCPDAYAACFKFRTDDWTTCVPPFITGFLQLAGLEDLIDIQAEADELSIYKLIYLPMTVRSNSTTSDEFEITPDISNSYFNKMLKDGVIPDGVGAAMVPGKELKYIDFSKTVDSDINSVEMSSNQILQTLGGGAVINANNITSTAAFNAWLKSETEFALSTLMPQVNGFANRFLSYHMTKPAHVEHFEVSIYTREGFAESLLESCKYSFANRIAYNTCLGFSERETLAFAFLENDVLGLPEIMKYPLQSSYTQSGSDNGYTSEVGQGAPTKADDQIGESGERARNR